MNDFNPNSSDSSPIRFGREWLRPAHEQALPWLGKRGTDIAFSLLTMIAAVPLGLAVALAVWVLDGRPVFYTQQRLGCGGRPFTLYKFRTMEKDSEPENHPVWAVRDDPRSTRFGALLRRVGLDELPQLWNVLRGEMSLVGPRPEREEFAREFERHIQGFGRRLEVLPGITGYAQIYGWRGDSSIEERLRHDLYYIEQGSAVLDLWIMLRTPGSLWSERPLNGVPPAREPLVQR